jgi:hypothetical protein
MSGNFGVYSLKQFESISTAIGMNNNKIDKPYIYYFDINNNIVQITEVFNDAKKKSNFDDAVYLGQLKKFHSTSIKPIPKL